MTAFDGTSCQEAGDAAATEPLNPVDNKHAPRIVAGVGEIFAGNIVQQSAASIAVTEPSSASPLPQISAPLMTTRAVCIQVRNRCSQCDAHSPKPVLSVLNFARYPSTRVCALELLCGGSLRLIRIFRIRTLRVTPTIC